MRKGQTKRAWTEEEELLLFELREQGFQYAHIARIIGRTDDMTRAHAKAMRNRAYERYETIYLSTNEYAKHWSAISSPWGPCTIRGQRYVWQMACPHLPATNIPTQGQ